MRLDASGNLGLGVTPSAWSGVTALQLAGSGFIASNNQYLEISTNTYYNAGYKYIGTGLATDYSQQAGKHIWFTAASGTAGNPITFTQAMTLDASGRLGIATTSPGTLLNIKDNSSAAIQIKTADSNFSALNIGVNTTAGHIAINSTASGGTTQPLSFQMGGTPAMTLDASGNLGIGTTSPSTYVGSGGLALSGSYGTATTAFAISNATAGSANNIARIDFRLANTFGGLEKCAAIWALNPNAGANNGGALVFGVSANGTATTPTEAARIDASGNLLTGGKTSATSNSGDIQVSRGIGFPATQVACSDVNTLDDYEEGTWTPGNAGSGVTVTANNPATYTKIGRMVTINAFITIGANSNAGTFYISGLPFVANNYFSGAIGYNTNATYPDRTLLFESNTTSFGIRNPSAFRIWANYSGVDLIFTCTYFV
jgi:hypothetical protein